MPNRQLRRALIVAGTAFAALVFFLSGVTLRVLTGPISLGPFRGTIESALNASVTGLVIRFDQAELEWSRDTGKVNLAVLGTRVFDLEGHIIAQAPKADVDFDAAALLAGRIEPTEFTLVGVQLTAVRKLDGTMRVGFDAAGADSDVLEAIMKSLKGGGPTKLDRFAIRGARLAFHDDKTGFFLVAPRAALTISARKAGMHADLSADIEVSGKPATMTASAELNDDGWPRSVDVRLHQFELSSLAENSAEFSAFRMLGLRTEVMARADIAADQSIGVLTFDVRGSGAIGEPGHNNVRVPIGSLHLAGKYNGPDGSIKFDDFTVGGDRARGKFIASLSVKKMDGGAVSVSGTLEARALYFDTPGLFAQPVSFNGATLAASYTSDAKTLTVSRLSVTAGPLAIEVSGAATFDGSASPAITVEGSIAQLPVRDLVKYWPLRVAAGAREWLDPNVSDGIIGPMRLNADIASGALDKEKLPEDAVLVTFPFANVTATYVKGMTPLTDAVGTGRLTGDTFVGTVIGANIGTLPVSAGDVRIPNLHVRAAPGFLHAHVEGPVSEILALINQDPLNYPKRFRIDPAKAGGRGKIDADFTIPMLKNLSVDQMNVAVKAQTTDMSLPLDEHRALTNANETFVIDGKGLTAEGTGAISEVPVTWRWTENFSPGNAMSTHLELNGTLDDDGRKRLGLEGMDWLTGSLRCTLQLEGRRGKLEVGAVQTDMTGASINLRPINWVKAVGVPATLSSALTFGDAHAIELSNLSVSGSGVQVHGALDLSGDGELTRANFDKVVVGGNNDFNAHWQVNADGSQAVQLQGKSMDASRLFGSGAKKPAAPLSAQPETDFTQPLHVDVHLDRLLLRADQSLRNILLNADFGPDERVDRFSLAADGPLKGKVAGGLSAAGNRRRLTITADDGGALIAAFTGFPSVRGGALVMSAEFNASPRDQQAGKPVPVDYEGSLEFKDFTLMNQPFLARFFAVGSLDGPLRLLQGQGIAFDHLTVPFSARGKRVTIDEGRASGPAIGISIEGAVDRRTDQVDLGGALVPVYGLNSVLGNVPIVGNILVSKQGEGIFGLTYTAKGDVDEPKVNINPLSALTPGIFRRIFEYSGPKDSTAQAAPPAATAKTPAN